MVAERKCHGPHAVYFETREEKKRETRYIIRVVVKIYIHEVDPGIGLVKLRCPIIGCNP